MNKTKYKNEHRLMHYDRIELAVPKGMKDIIKGLAGDRSINSYICDLVRKDQEGLFAGIKGNMHDGYDVIFKDGHTCHCRTKKDVRTAIISYLTEDSKSLTEDT